MGLDPVEPDLWGPLFHTNLRNPTEASSSSLAQSASFGEMEKVNWNPMEYNDDKLFYHFNTPRRRCGLLMFIHLPYFGVRPILYSSKIYVDSKKKKKSQTNDQTQTQGVGWQTRGLFIASFHLFEMKRSSSGVTPLYALVCCVRLFMRRWFWRTLPCRHESLLWPSAPWQWRIWN